MRLHIWSKTRPTCGGQRNKDNGDEVGRSLVSLGKRKAEWAQRELAAWEFADNGVKFAFQERSLEGKHMHKFGCCAENSLDWGQEEEDG